MFRERASVQCFALAILLTMAVIVPVDYDLRPSFGEIDPAYRSAFSDTAWFIKQPRDSRPKQRRNAPTGEMAPTVQSTAPDIQANVALAQSHASAAER